MNPYKKESEIKTIYGIGIVKDVIERKTTISLYNVSVFYVYDVNIAGKMRRIFESEIIKDVKKTPVFEIKDVILDYVEKESAISSVKQKQMEDVQRRCEEANKLVKAGINVYMACKQAGVDRRSYFRRY